MSEEITIQKNTVKKFILFTALLAIVVVGFFSVKSFVSAQPAGTGYAAANLPTQNGIQTVKVTMSSGQYIMQPGEFKKDVPVRMEFDLSTVNGCYRSVVIPGYNIRKYIKPGDNTIEFTPNKAGTFGITCSMGMGRGQFKVAESDGSQPSSYTDPSIKQQGSSGSCGSGGCGCGGR